MKKTGAAEGTRTPACSLASCRTTPILRPHLDEKFITRCPKCHKAPRLNRQWACRIPNEISLPARRALTSPPGISFAGAQSSRPLRDRYKRGQISGHLRSRRSPANDDAFDACLCPVLCAFWFSSRFGPVVVTEISQVPSPAASASSNNPSTRNLPNFRHFLHYGYS
jgi:hypothetical protein